MITHSHRWPYPMLPSPRNPCQDQSQQNCSMSSQQDVPCPSSKKEENKLIDMQSEYFVSISPQLQVNSEIIGNCGFKVEEQNQSLDLSVGSSQKQVKTIGNLIESISFDRKKQIKRRRKQVGLEKTDNMKSVSCQQSKCWNEEQSKLFYELVQKYGTDFNFIKQFFPNKSKSQIKNKHKELFNMEKKNKRKVGENKEKVAKKEERLMALVSTAQSEAMKKIHQEESEISR